MEASDVKTMYEALVDLLDGICFHCDLSEDCKGMPCEKVQKAKAALAAPPRNCDMLSADQCKQIFKSEMEVYLPQEATDNDREIARRTAYGVIDALFAPYTEQEGESDGSK